MYTGTVYSKKGKKVQFLGSGGNTTVSSRSWVSVGVCTYLGLGSGKRKPKMSGVVFD